jgi:hypothetical protein
MNTDRVDQSRSLKETVEKRIQKEQITLVELLRCCLARVM